MFLLAEMLHSAELQKATFRASPVGGPCAQRVLDILIVSCLFSCLVQLLCTSKSLTWVYLYLLVGAAEKVLKICELICPGCPPPPLHLPDILQSTRNDCRVHHLKIESMQNIYQTSTNNQINYDNVH